MPTRAQAEAQITWAASNTKSILADGNFYESDDFVVSGDMIAIAFTINGNSAGIASNDILEVHCRIKKDPNFSNGGIPDTYDTTDTFRLALDCSNGGDNQQTMLLGEIMAGDTIHFACKNNGTNAIVAGIRITEDKLEF